MTEIVSRLAPSGGDFTSVSAWLASLGTVSGSDEPVLEFEGGDYGGPNGALVDAAVISAGLIPSAANRLQIRPAAGHGHGGVRGSSFIWQNSTSECVQILSDYVTITGVEFRCDGNSQYAVEIQNPVGVVLDALLLDAGPVSGGITQLSFVNFNLDNLIIRRCEIINAGLRAFSLARGATVQGCTAIDSGVGFQSANQVLFENCVAHNNTTGFSGAVDAGSRNNRASDGTAPGSATGPNTVNGDFEGYPSNLVPASGGELDGNGADLSAVMPLDIAGATYPVPFDIGARSRGAVASTLTFDGPDVADVAATGGEAYSQPTAAKWSTNAPTVTYARTGTAWPAGIDLDVNTGEINGTPGPADVGTTSGHTITATDSFGGVVASNAFDITVVAPPPPVYDPAHPADVTVNDGSVASFTPIITESAAITATAWQELPPGGEWTTIIPTVASPTLSFTATLSEDGYRYRRVDFDEYGSGNASPDALLTVEQGNYLASVDPASVTVTSYDLIVTIGEAPVREVSGSGAAASQSAAASGSATTQSNVQGAGAGQAQSATVSGQAQRFRNIAGDGSAVAQSAQASGQNDREVVGSGDCVSQQADCSGERAFTPAKFVFGVKKENGR